MEKKPFFMVFVEGEKTPSYKHSELDLAEHEAKRLSDLTGKTAYVLCSLKAITAPIKYVIEDVRPPIDSLPF